MQTAIASQVLIEMGTTSNNEMFVQIILRFGIFHCHKQQLRNESDAVMVARDGTTFFVSPKHIRGWIPMNKKELKIMARAYDEIWRLYNWKARQLLSYYYAIKHPNQENAIPFHDFHEDIKRLMKQLKEDAPYYNKVSKGIAKSSEQININNYSKYVYDCENKTVDKNDPDYLISLSRYCYNLSDLYKYVCNNMNFFTIEVMLDLDSLCFRTSEKIFRAMGFFEAKYKEQLKNLKGAHVRRDISLRNIQELRELLMRQDSTQMMEKSYRRKFINKAALELDVTSRTIENWLKKIESEPV